MAIFTPTKEKNFVENYVTTSILDCVRFWENSGAWEKNKSGEFGNKITQASALKKEEDDFLMDCLLFDVKAFTESETAKNSGIVYDYGRTRSHIWLHANGERILMIASNKFL